MAVHAVFARRGVFPQERAALLRVAGVTGFIDIAVYQHRIAAAAVRCMAGSAGLLTIAQRMRRAAMHFGTYFGVTTQAARILCCRVLHGVARGMTIVATGAGKTFQLVQATFPVMHVIAARGMAGQALRVAACRVGFIKRKRWRRAMPIGINGKVTC